MFKKATLRFYAGMLFGSTAGVFLAIGFAAVANSHLGDRAELEKMDELLRHVMWGAFFGLFFGGFIALLRKPLLSAFVAATLATLAMFLSVALFGPGPEAVLSRLGLGAGAMVLGAGMGEMAARWFASGSVPDDSTK